jgi:hypothetical protein
MITLLDPWGKKLVTLGTANKVKDIWETKWGPQQAAMQKWASESEIQIIVTAPVNRNSLGVSLWETGGKISLHQGYTAGNWRWWCDLLKRIDPSMVELGRKSWKRSQLLRLHRNSCTLDGVDPYYISNSFITHTLAWFWKTPTTSHLENTMKKNVLSSSWVLETPKDSRVVSRVDQSNRSH